ncbi:MAG: YiiX/YebB-like N1pC/P60 family cysteine hydrolase [Endozoicomonadaceae bacterium]|nr:YiiX/YebB-like N1pC/P60 family cysteine hydrolase [Endozoicomonadaceae bacterium]
MMFFSVISRLAERWLMREIKQPDTSLCDFERIRHELKSCDVLLIEGRSRVSKIIQYLTQSNWTHSALYIGRIYDIENIQLRSTIRAYYDGPEEEQLIIESELGLGTVVRPLKNYKKEHIRICRPKNLGHNDGEQIITYAASQLGKKYSARQAFDLMRFFFPYKALPPRLGSSLFKFKPGNATKTVCSSMIAEAFYFIQYPILPLVKSTGEDNKVKLYQRNPKLCTPKDFDYSPYFEIIKYPFFDCSHYYGSYKLLPWGNDEQQLQAEENYLYITQEQIEELKNANNSSVLLPKEKS